MSANTTVIIIPVTKLVKPTPNVKYPINTVKPIPNNPKRNSIKPMLKCLTRFSPQVFENAYVDFFMALVGERP